MNYLDKKGAGGKLTLSYTLFFLCVAAFFILAGCRVPTILKGGDENPHLKKECNLCHKAPGELLLKVERGEGDGADMAKAKALKSDLIGICNGCHTPGNGDHAVGAVPKINRRNLPLDPDGRITCAVTCHDVHTKGIDNPAVIKGLLRLPPAELCLSCHDK